MYSYQDLPYINPVSNQTSLEIGGSQYSTRLVEMPTVTFSSFVVVYRIKGGQTQILAEVKDTSDTKKFKLPGGSREISDTSPITTAARELYEETGISFEPNKLEFLEQYEFHRVDMATKSEEMRRASIFSIQVPVKTRIITCNGDDIAEHRWVTPEVFLESSRYQSYSLAVKKFVEIRTISSF